MARRNGRGRSLEHDHQQAGPRSIRCAIYTRKSTEEGLDQEFNSLDAQREAAEAYIQSQRHEGWVAVSERYDDGGFSGGNMERPALKRLMADIEEGRVDSIVVYKVDRLSRSLLDFARLIEVFDQHEVAFVSVTQQFNTRNSLGRLTLHILLSFAQFERELISERTRDKMSAARKKGKWVGGTPILGYDLGEKGGRLVVNQSEAAQVRQVFETYLETGSLLSTAVALNKRGWRMKSWTTRKGARRGGGLWSKENVRGLLTNLAYVGRVNYREKIYPGEHPAIVDEEVFERARKSLEDGRREGASRARNAYGYLLKGLVRCTSCGSSMTPTTTMKRNGRSFRYYMCVKARKSGRDACPVRSVPAEQLERFVVERVRAIARDPELLDEVVSKATAPPREQIAGLQEESRMLGLEGQRVREEARGLVGILAGQPKKSPQPSITERITMLDQRAEQIDRRLAEIREELLALDRTIIDPDQAREALGMFDPVWDALEPRERERLLRLVIEKIEFDGVQGEIALTLHALGIKRLAEEPREEEPVAETAHDAADHHTRRAPA